MSHKQLAAALEVGKNVYTELRCAVRIVLLPHLVLYVYPVCFRFPSQPRRKAQSALLPASKVTVTREIPNQSTHGVYSLHFVPDTDYVAIGRGNGSIGVSCLLWYAHLLLSRLFV